MYQFVDYYGNEVCVDFTFHPFCTEPKHIWVLCRYEEKWLLTKHKHRGIEFPGGKVDVGETPEEAAVREVQEETGGIVSDLQYIGQYEVRGKGSHLVKNIYFAEVSKLQNQENFHETEGPVLLETLPEGIKGDKTFSFMMRDDVLQLALERVREVVLGI